MYQTGRQASPGWGGDPKHEQLHGRRRSLVGPTPARGERLAGPAHVPQGGNSARPAATLLLSRKARLLRGPLTEFTWGQGGNTTQGNDAPASPSRGPHLAGMFDGRARLEDCSGRPTGWTFDPKEARDPRGRRTGYPVPAHHAVPQHKLRGRPRSGVQLTGPKLRGILPGGTTGKRIFFGAGGSWWARSPPGGRGTYPATAARGAGPQRPTAHTWRARRGHLGARPAPVVADAFSGRNRTGDREPVFGGAPSVLFGLLDRRLFNPSVTGIFMGAVARMAGKHRAASGRVHHHRGRPQAPTTIGPSALVFRDIDSGGATRLADDGPAGGTTPRNPPTALGARSDSTPSHRRGARSTRHGSATSRDKQRG